ncbi:MAG: hypothetical protein ACT4P2_14480 [Pseudomonadota bacterium]
MRFTEHGWTRLAQRGLRPSDVDLILRFGTEVADGYLLRRRDVSEAVSGIKRTMQQLERLRGSFVVTGESSVITAYRPTRRKERRLLAK